MIYVVKETGLDAPYFAVSALLSRCSYYAESADLALQRLFSSDNSYVDSNLDEFERLIHSSSAYTIIATYSPDSHPEYFI